MLTLLRQSLNGSCRYVCHLHSACQLRPVIESSSEHGCRTFAQRPLWHHHVEGLLLKHKEKMGIGIKCQRIQKSSRAVAFRENQISLYQAAWTR